MFKDKIKVWTPLLAANTSHHEKGAYIKSRIKGKMSEAGKCKTLRNINKKILRFCINNILQTTVNKHKRKRRDNPHV